uniref:DEP domain-containing protein n=2 Tax=Pyramimonas obovata TaxID=1411642 RepID=A0A7S0WST3_9CHLO|mmetsp:Transcript_38263/g.83240  ORF Transcript_38263/g.83240 Transcript_38263/m.83240 type:complete len:498 (+) Transcript_38263:528-2021(+)|eukprot:CAMPEP_0118922880 /NCGR_PEP_ID=MMETSP1169-20130426/1637_1 /TAXON_ID=36882 /ORGANISM="Pyramimonas obovata, Strain CCMP722" /LENGTH=497 /DNA_ID=CAMNT_0006863809 /DNA_START=523 /DNA_END=2016 /DNA_ORIENTATION=-
MSGRITIFSLSTCPHCNRVKGLFKEKKWEYFDISLTEYPEKRVDMLQLTDRLTVPQIFFNETYVGDASTVIALEASGKLQEMYDKMRTEPEPTNPMLSRPSYPPKPDPVPAARTDAEIYVGGRNVLFTDVLWAFEQRVSIEDRAYNMSTYSSCFVGSEAVDFLMKLFELKNRDEAVRVGQKLQETGMFDHVLGEHPFLDEGYFYRLSIHKGTKVLNAVRRWTDRIDDPMVTLSVCKKMFSAIQSTHMDSEGLVDYAAMAEDRKYRDFQEAICEFQRVDIQGLDHNAKLAFFINLYNLVVLHAFTELGVPTSSIQRSKYFDEAKYIVGGFTLSLTDIENGILRANRKAPYHFGKQFGGDRVAVEVLPLKQCEPRIHFALNCGAKSCPPIKSFTKTAVLEELRIVAMAFLEGDDNCRVDEKDGFLYLSMIFKWYAEDFGSSSLDVAKFVVQFLRGAKKEALQRMIDANNVKRKFLTYDWSTNAKAHRKFKTDSWMGIFG